MQCQWFKWWQSEAASSRNSLAQGWHRETQLHLPLLWKGRWSVTAAHAGLTSHTHVIPTAGANILCQPTLSYHGVFTICLLTQTLKASLMVTHTQYEDGEYGLQWISYTFSVIVLDCVFCCWSKAWSWRKPWAVQKDAIKVTKFRRYLGRRGSTPDDAWLVVDFEGRNISFSMISPRWRDQVHEAIWTVPDDWSHSPSPTQAWIRTSPIGRQSINQLPVCNHAGFIVTVISYILLAGRTRWSRLTRQRPFT